MRCPACGCNDSKVIDSRANDNATAIRRRRECTQCARRFTTYEAIEIDPVFVIKKTGVRQAFSPAKLRSGILKACEKRPVSIELIDSTVADITKRVENMLSPEITSTQIGDLVMEKLKTIDDVAYVRFAAVHRQFKDLNSWLLEINRLVNTKDKP